MPRLKMKTIFKILFAPLLWLLQGCSPLGNPVNEELSDNHYYDTSKTKVIYSPMGNWFAVGKTEMDADVESFEVMNRYFGKDKNRIYFEAYAAEDSTLDFSSFYVKNEDYLENLGFDDNHVFAFEKVLKNKEYQIKVISIESADPKTYRRTTWDWAKDGKHHFYRNTKIDADYNTFEVLNDYFAKDSTQTFSRQNQNFKPFLANLESFKILENSSHGIDEKFVYWLAFFTKDKPLVMIPHNGLAEVDYLNRYFLRVADTIYYDGATMPNIDAKSFQVINELYTKDANFVYYKNQIIEDADVETFGFSNDGMGIHDKNGSYRDGKLITKN